MYTDGFQHTFRESSLSLGLPRCYIDSKCAPSCQFEGLVDDYYRESHDQDQQPLVKAQGHDAESRCEEGDVQDEEVQAERHRHR